MMHSPYALERAVLERLRERRAEARHARLRRERVMPAEPRLLAALLRRLERLRGVERARGTLTGAA